MPHIATNDKGDVLLLNEQTNAWEPAHTASNDAGDTVYFDGQGWQPVPKDTAQPASPPAGAGGGTASGTRPPAEPAAGFDPLSQPRAAPQRPVVGGTTQGSPWSDYLFGPKPKATGFLPTDTMREYPYHLEENVRAGLGMAGHGGNLAGNKGDPAGIVGMLAGGFQALSAPGSAALQPTFEGAVDPFVSKPLEKVTGIPHELTDAGIGAATLLRGGGGARVGAVEEPLAGGMRDITPQTPRIPSPAGPRAPTDEPQLPAPSALPSQPLEGEVLPPGQAMPPPQQVAPQARALAPPSSPPTGGSPPIAPVAVPPPAPLGGNSAQEYFSAIDEARRTEERARGGYGIASDPYEDNPLSDEDMAWAEAHDRELAGGPPQQPPTAPPPPPGAQPPGQQPPAQGAPNQPDLSPQGLSDDLFRIRQSRASDMAEIMQNLARMPDAVRNPLAMNRMFRAGEGDPEVQLTPQELQAFNDHIEPMRRELSELYAELKYRNAPDHVLDDMLPDPTYMHRIVKGKAPQFDVLEGSGDVNPVYGQRQLSRKPSPMQARSVFTLQAPDGTRRVVTGSPEGVFTWDHGKKTPQPQISEDELKVGNQVAVGKEQHEVVSARSQEVQDHTPIKYHQNAFANTADALVRMRAAVRAVRFLDRVTQSPEWKQIATQGRNKPPPEGWRQSTLPQLQGWYMRPDIADVFDDFVGHKLANWEQAMQAVNRVAVGSIFWNPIPHIENVATHWFVGRGWDNFNIKALRHFGEAWREVVTQGPKYREFLREGGGLVYGGVANRDFYANMMQKLGQQIERHSSAWDPIVKHLGFTGVPHFMRWWYSSASKVLWSVGDVFMMQRYLENTAKGMSKRAAIKEAERHIPNYRLPTKVLNSRGFSQFLQNPAFDMFSRYHYGMFKSYANMLRDFWKGTKEEKLHAAGNAFALGVLGMMVYPALSYAIQAITGNKDAKKLPRGPLAIPAALIDFYNGDKTFPEILRNSITATPALDMASELYGNRDSFTGQHIIQSGGDPGRGAAQMTEYLMQQMVSPYGLAAQAWRDPRPNAAARMIGRQILGYSDPVPPQPTPRYHRDRKWYPDKKDFYNARDLRSRLRKPHGPIESGYESVRKQLYKGPSE